MVIIMIKWNKETIQKVHDLFKDGQDFETIAKAMGGTVPQVRGKLVSMGLYKAEAKAKPSGEHKVTKAELISQVAKLLGIADTAKYQLNGLTKSVLETLISKLAGNEETTKEG